MELSDYVDSLRDQLTGFGILESELTDEAYQRIVNVALKEMNRYYNATELLEVDGASCIDLKDHPEIANISNVYRTQGLGFASDNAEDKDPVLISQLQMYNFGSQGYTNNWIYRYGAYSTAQQTANTMSTDLMFKEDKLGQKLYVNLPQGIPEKLTIEYVPVLRDASQVKGRYWQDILLRLSLAHAKIALGRARTRFTQQGALWSSDGEGILSEGREELNALRERLNNSVDLFMPLD